MNSSNNLGLTRRRVLASAGAAAGMGLLAGGCESGTSPTASASAAHPFYGSHQSGIATPPQSHLLLAAVDLASETASDLRDVLGDWSTAAARLMRGERAVAGPPNFQAPPPDPGEADGLGPAALTITFGLGASLFIRRGKDRLGLAFAAPRALRPLPPFRGEALSSDQSDGDLVIQASADDPQVAFHAMHALTRIAADRASIRWAAHGSRSHPPNARGGMGHRNLFGFREGTRNVDPKDAAAMTQHVWAGGGREGDWMRGGTYLVFRRVQMLFDVWDSTTLEGQERVFGRRKSSGAPLGGRSELDPLDLNAQRGGQPLVPTDAHVRLAAPETNGGRRLLRRSYSFAEGVEKDTGQLDAGLLFMAFQRDPHEQFVPIQRRLAESDALSKHTLHVGSALFACPPGAQPGGFVGETLFA